MNSRIDEIMKNYKNNLEKIDKRYVLSKKEKESINNELLEKNNGEKAIKAEKSNQNIEQRRQENKINEIIEIMNGLPMGLEYYEYKKELDRAQEELKAIKEQQEEIDNKLSEENITYVHGETEDDRKQEMKRLAKEKEAKIIYDRRKAKVILPSGREVTQDEKDKLDKSDIRNLAIKELTAEKKSIDRQMKILQMQYNNKLLQMDIFEYKYDVKEDGTKIPINGKDYKALLDGVEEVQAKMSDLKAEQEKCDKYINEIKEVFKQEMKPFENALKRTTTVVKEEPTAETKRGEETQEQVVIPNGEDTQGQTGTREEEQQETVIPETPVIPTPSVPTIEHEPEETTEEHESEGYEERVFSDESRKKEFSGEQKNPLYQITVGKKVIICDGNKKHVLKENVLKEGVNLSQTEFNNLLKKYIDEEFAGKYLGIIDKKENSEEIINGSIQFLKEQRNQVNPAVLYAIDKMDAEEQTKKNIIKEYLDKAVMGNEASNIDIVYDANELSKVNIFNRIRKKEVNNKEKFELLKNAKLQTKFGTVKIEGEYKPNWLENLIGKITRNQTMALPTQSDIKVAYKANEYYGEELSRSQMKEATKDMTKSEAKTFKQLIKYNVESVDEQYEDEMINPKKEAKGHEER